MRRFIMLLAAYYVSNAHRCVKGPGSQKVLFFSNKLDLHILRNETRVVGKDFGEVWTLNSQNSLQELRCKLVFFSPSGEILYFRWISEL